MNFIVKDLADGVWVTFDARRLDAVIAVQFKDMMRDIIAQKEGRVILDLSNVQFVDSSGLGAIVSIYKLLGSKRVFELANPTITVSKVLKLTRMDSVFTIHPSRTAEELNAL